ncbi:MAG: PHP domain-containing protein [Armatimonadota bacterium]|nr:PHP domain-containing protein [Armatimonadota bacterium]
MSQPQNGAGFADYHLHTEHSYCCEDITAQRLADFARNWPHPLAITDHSAHFVYGPSVWRDFGSDAAAALMEARRTEARQAVLAYIEKMRSLMNGRALLGTELDVLPDGRPVFPEELLPRLDILVGAVHVLPSIRQSLPHAEVMREWRGQVTALMGLGVHILAHPFRLLMQKQIPVTAEDVEWVVETARHHGAALELNSHYRFPELDRQMVSACLRAGVKVAIGTDAHRWDEVGAFSYHEAVLSECGVTTPEARHKLLYRHEGP